VDGFTPAALDAMLHHAWPGNVRELQHAVERGVFMGRSPRIEITDLPPAVAAGGNGIPAASPNVSATSGLKNAMAQPERQLIIDALSRHGWRRDAAARSLGINRTTLYKKLKRLGMDLATLQPTDQ
jgi:DNA-binding NtrC family response regulator